MHGFYKHRYRMDRFENDETASKLNSCATITICKTFIFIFLFKSLHNVTLISFKVHFSVT